MTVIAMLSVRLAYGEHVDGRLYKWSEKRAIRSDRECREALCVIDWLQSQKRSLPGRDKFLHVLRDLVNGYECKHGRVIPL
jgi:hypothetical protein